MIEFARYLANLPLLHSWDGGQSWNTGGFDARQLAVFYRLAGGDQGGRSIIETGAGNSTLTFLFANPEKLVSLAPAAELFQRIRDYCTRSELDATPLQAVVERSEVGLPRIALAKDANENVFDLGLIDGGHGWPTAFVDFCYINSMLRRGGILLVDDVQLHSVKELARLLAKQPGFRLVADLGKVLAFEKLSDERLLPDFGSQPYIVEQTAAHRQTSDPFEL